MTSAAYAVVLYAVAVMALRGCGDGVRGGGDGVRGGGDGVRVITYLRVQVHPCRGQ